MRLTTSTISKLGFSTRALLPLVLVLVIGGNFNRRGSTFHNSDSSTNYGLSSSSSSSSSMTAMAIPFKTVLPVITSGWFYKAGPAESIFFGLIVLKVIALRMAGVFPYHLNDMLTNESIFNKFIAENFHGLWGGVDKKIDNELVDLADKKKFPSKEEATGAGSLRGVGGKKRKQRDLFFTKFPSYPSPTSQKWNLDEMFNIKQQKKQKKQKKVGSGLSKLPILKEIGIIERMLLGLRRIDTHDCLIRHVCQINQNALAGNSTASDDAILKIFSLKPRRDSIMKPQSTDGGGEEQSIIESSIWDIYHEALTPSIVDCSHKYQLCPLTPTELSPMNLLNGLF